MSTLVLPFNASLPDDVAAYTLQNKKSYIQASPVESITKDQPVLIVAEAGSYTFTGDAAADYSTTTPPIGSLVGTYFSIDATAGNYVLQKHGEEVAAFYQLAANSNKVINPFRAYLSSESGEARSLSIVFDDEETTGVSSVSRNMEEVRGTYFDLMGRKVAQPTKGLYIMNGKKVIVK